MTTPTALCLSSHVAWGSVGNTIAGPALAALGVTPLMLPTVVLSNHPGLGAPAGQRTGDGEFAAMLERLEASDALHGCGGVLTGYFASPAQVAAAAAVVKRLKQRPDPLLYLCDPVIGDDGGLYVPDAVATAIRDLLLPLADIATPNAFELSWLTAAPVAGRDSAVAAAQALMVPEVVVTSVPEPQDALALVRVAASGIESIAWPRQAGVPHGTGDLFAGLLLGGRIRGHDGEAAFRAAAAVLKATIDRDAGEAQIDPSRLVRNIAQGRL
jgi:pyridoxine kinase